jgi:hypothetical protein
MFSLSTNAPSNELQSTRYWVSLVIDEAVHGKREKRFFTDAKKRF